ncbi:MAG: esterase [Bacteroidales bacterium]|nr:esterase [Bacteroidales bacterium]
MKITHCFECAGRPCRIEIVAPAQDDAPREDALLPSQPALAPQVLLLEPIDEHDLNFLGRETAYLAQHAKQPFALVTFLVNDWNRELTPWPAEAVFGREPFGAGSGETLRFITDELISRLEELDPALRGLGVMLGGYSLAALFALWAGYESDRFAAIAAASPSVWYPGWMDFARTHRPRAGRIYLSLGDCEERTRNRVMASVASCIREQAALLDRQGIPSLLEWNPGNHFQDTDLRTAKAFLWAMTL